MQTTIRSYIILFTALIILPVVLFPKSEGIKIDYDTFGYGNVVPIGKYAKYRTGDNKIWADPDYNDARWRTGDPGVIPDTLSDGRWKGVGWFRFTLDVDSSYFNKPLALHVIQAGACEVFLNGELVYAVGSPGKNEYEEETEWDQEYPKIVILNDDEEQVIAVRYSNFSVQHLKEFNYGTGFELSLAEPEVGITSRTERDKLLTGMKIFMSVVPVLFGFIHLMMFFFDKSQTGNLFFSIFTFCLAATNFLEFTAFTASGPIDFVFIRLINVYPSTISVIFMLLFTYDSFNAQIPKHFIGFLIAGIGILVWSFFHFNGTVYLIVYVYAFLSLVEISRIIIIAFMNKTVKMNFLILGYLFFVAALSTQFISKFGVNLPMMVYPLYFLGVAVLILFMSIHLSQKYAHISKELAAEVKVVKELSAIKIAQERQAREREIEKKLLEADNERKTKELNEARKLQISMLPAEIPVLDKLEIQTYIKTATEVGGDYYDFHVKQDSDFTLAIGDATGHGMKAGTLVSSTKGLFKALVPDHNPLEMTVKINHAIKNMNLPTMYMALLIARFNSRSFDFSNSGMPPVLQFKAKSGEIRTHIQKSMPLGAFTEFKYRTDKVEYEKGDIFLFSSDGLIELFDKDDHMLGLDGMVEFFKDSLSEDLSDIKSHLIKKILSRSGFESLRDDLTFVLIKIK